MTILLTLVALAALGIGGWGAGVVRAEPRAPGVPFARSLSAGRRRTGAAIAAGALAVLLLVLLVRP